MRQILYFFICTIVVSLVAEQGNSSFVPSSVDDSDFRSLTAQSPFTRSIDLSDSLILTGIATMNDSRVATLLNKETKETFVVSSKANSQGWKMVELKEDSDLEKVSAKVAVEGGEVVTVRYAEWQLKPGEARPGAGPSEGGEVRDGGKFSGKGKGKGDGRRGPPPEMREKMMKLSEEQRGKLFQKMMELREKNPDMPREERGKIMMGLMDQMIQKK